MGQLDELVGLSSILSVGADDQSLKTTNLSRFLPVSVQLEISMTLYFITPISCYL